MSWKVVDSAGGIVAVAISETTIGALSEKLLYASSDRSPLCQGCNWLRLVD